MPSGVLEKAEQRERPNFVFPASLQELTDSEMPESGIQGWKI